MGTDTGRRNGKNVKTVIKLRKVTSEVRISAHHAGSSRSPPLVVLSVLPSTADMFSTPVIGLEDSSESEDSDGNPPGLATPRKRSKHRQNAAGHVTQLTKAAMAARIQTRENNYKARIMQDFNKTLKRNGFPSLTHSEANVLAVELNQSKKYKLAHLGTREDIWHHNGTVPVRLMEGAIESLQNMRREDWKDVIDTYGNAALTSTPSSHGSLVDSLGASLGAGLARALQPPPDQARSSIQSSLQATFVKLQEINAEIKNELRDNRNHIFSEVYGERAAMYKKFKEEVSVHFHNALCDDTHAKHTNAMNTIEAIFPTTSVVNKARLMQTALGKVTDESIVKGVNEGAEDFSQ